VKERTENQIDLSIRMPHNTGLKEIVFFDKGKESTFFLKQEKKAR
jgi:hypothetical protein